MDNVVEVKHNKFKVKKLFSEDNIFNFVNRLLILFFAFLVAYPLLYIFFASISSGIMVDSGMVRFFPRQVTFAAYKEVLGDWLFWRSYANSIYITTVGSMFSIVISLTGAYALSKKQLPGHRFFNFVLLFTMWFSAGMIPTYLNLQNLGLLNYTGLIIGFGINAFNIVILRSAFYSVPKEMMEAARVDGAGEFRVFWNIAVPSIKPSITTVWLLYAIGRWNGFFWAMIIIGDERWIPLQVYLRTITALDALRDIETTAFITETAHSNTTIIYAIIIFSIIPILIIFPLIQKVFKRGIMEGGIKG